VKITVAEETLTYSTGLICRVMMFTGKPKAGRIGHAVIGTATLFRPASCYIIPLHYCRMLMSGHGFMYAVFDCELASHAVSVVKGNQFCYFPSYM